MDNFLKRIKKEINRGLSVVSAKSKELLDAAKINNQIAELIDKRKQTLQEIGQLVYQMSLATDVIAENAADDNTDNDTQITNNDTQIIDKCKLVAELEQQIEEKELELKKLRTDTQETLGKAICESCGAAMEVGTKYCSNCGARMVTVEK